MYKDIKISDVKDFILRQFGENPNICFYKGISSNSGISDFLLTDYSKIRKSKTSKIHGNYYNTFLNNLDSWQTFPKRENSIIFTNEEETAQAFASDKNYKFGKTFVVIPSNKSRIVISPAKDIWESFSQGLGKLSLRGKNNDLTIFNNCLHNIFEAYEVDGSRFNLTEIQTNLKIILNIGTKKELDFATTLLYNSLLKQRDNLPSYFDECFSPEQNGFEIVNYDLKWKLESRNKEIWTDSLAILINIDLLDEVLS